MTKEKEKRREGTKTKSWMICKFLWMGAIRKERKERKVNRSTTKYRKYEKTWLVSVNQLMNSCMVDIDNQMKMTVNKDIDSEWH